MKLTRLLFGKSCYDYLSWDEYQEKLQSISLFCAAPPSGQIKS